MHAIHPEDDIAPAEPHAESVEHTPLALILDELNQGGWPALLLERRLPEALAHAATLSPADRCAWLRGLHEVWQRHGWALTHEGKTSLLQLAAAWCAWPLAHAVGMSLQSEAPLEGPPALHLMSACRHLGDENAGIDLAIALQLAHPEEQTYANAHLELLAWQRWRERMPVIDGADWDDGELRLEPLAHHHLHDFAWQYYDPAIAELCCLPVFEDQAQWHSWLDGIYDAGDQRIFAVLHEGWGFVGCVSLILHETTGFFYYWIGPDFQGCGLGPRAVSLMLAMAQRDYGMRACYAKVYDYNAHSRRALEKLGFEELGICGVAPDDDQLFYRCGEQLPPEDMVDELHLLTARMGSDTRPAALLRATTGFRTLADER